MSGLARTMLGALPLALLLAGACGDGAPSPRTPAAPPSEPPPPALASANAKPASPPAVTPDADFRKEAPKPGPAVVFVPPKIQESRLANGARVLLVERHELPILAVDIVSDEGADQAASGLGGFTGATILAGTKTRNTLQLSDAFQAIGATYGATSDYDSLSIHCQSLTSKFPEALEVLADVVQNAVFPAPEVERERSRRLNLFAQQVDNPQTLLTNTVYEILFPARHAYRSSILGDDEAIKKTTPADLARFYHAHLQPDHVTIAVSGDITQAKLIGDLDKALGGWKGKAARRTTPPAVKDAEVKGPRIIVVDRPGSTQSNVNVAGPGVPRSVKDFDALFLMNTILGGQFSSRLNLNLREKHAYTYGAFSYFEMRHGAGPFRAGGAIVREATADAVKEIFTEIERIRRDGVTDEELADAKTYRIQQLPAQFETAGATAATLAGLAVYGLPLDEYATRPARWGKVTREDIVRVATTYLVPERLRVVIVGDAKAIVDGLTALKLGTPDVRQPRGTPKKE